MACQSLHNQLGDPPQDPNQNSEGTSRALNKQARVGSSVTIAAVTSLHHTSYRLGCVLREVDPMHGGHLDLDQDSGMWPLTDLENKLRQSGF